MKTKVCSCCNEEFPYESYYIKYKRKDGSFLRNKNCKYCCLKKSRKYQFGNKEKLKQKRKDYNRKNKDKIAKRTKIYQKNNKEKIEQVRKKLYEKNRDRILERMRIYYNRNKEEINAKKRKSLDHKIKNSEPQYAKFLLMQQGFKKEDITTELIEAKRQILKIKRLIKAKQA